MASIRNPKGGRVISVFLMQVFCQIHLTNSLVEHLQSSFCSFLNNQPVTLTSILAVSLFLRLSLFSGYLILSFNVTIDAHFFSLWIFILHLRVLRWDLFDLIAILATSPLVQRSRLQLLLYMIPFLIYNKLLFLWVSQWQLQFFKVLSHVIELLRDCWIRLHIYISCLIYCILCLTGIKGCSGRELSRSHSTRLYSNFIRILFERGCFFIWRLWYSLFHLFQLIPTATSVRNYSCISFGYRGKLKFIRILTEFFRFNSIVWIVYLILCWQSVLKNKLVFITTLKMGSSCSLSWVYDTLSWNLHIRGSGDEVSFTKLFTRIETIAIICVHWDRLYLRQHHHISI